MLTNIKAKDRLQFNTLMVEFYNTRKAENTHRIEVVYDRYPI
jgi:hypothetical protein